MRSHKLLGARLTSQQMRFQSSAATAKAANAVSVRATGYGPSGDILKGVPPHSHLSLITKAPLHPEDAAVQKEVLTLAMPSLGGVTVESRPRPPSYKPASLPIQAGDAAMPSHVTAAVAAELDLRIQMLELTVQAQLSTVANLVVDRIASQTDHQLATLQAAQAEHSQTLAQLIINCIQAELRTAGSGGPESQARLAEHVAQRVARVLQAVDQTALPSAAAPPLDTRVAQYFAQLESTMKKAVGTGGAGLSDGATKQILKAMDQAFRVQEESIRHAIKEVVPSGGGGGADASNRDLEEFIEGSLRAAADNIRLHITAELKKVNRAPARSSGGGGGGGADASVSTTTQLEAQLEQLVSQAAEMAATVARVDEAASDIFKEQTELKDMLMSLQRDAQRGQEDTHTDKSAPAATSEESQLIGTLTELKSLLWRVNSSLEVNQGKQETMLLDMAQSISDSVANTMAHDHSTGATTVVSKSVEEVLTANMSELLEKINASEQAVEERMSSIASIVSDAVRTALAEWQTDHHASRSTEHTSRIEHTATTSTTTADTSVASPSAEPASSPAVASTAELRDVLVAAVQQEMGKTHEVNLTPMYQYVDSILAFLKEELAQQNTSLTGQLEHIRGTLAGTQTPESVTLANLHTKVDQLLLQQRQPGASDAASLQSQFEAMEAAAKQRNEELLTTIKSSTTADSSFAEQLRAIEAVMKDESSAANVSSMAVNGKLEELALAVTEQRAVLDRIRDTQVQSEQKARVHRAEALSAEHKEQWRVLQEKRSSRIERISSLVRTMGRAPRTEQLGPLTANLTAELSALHTLEQDEKQLANAVTAPADSSHDGDPFAELHQALTRIAKDLSSSQSSVGDEVLTAIRHLPHSLTAEQMQARLDSVAATLLTAQETHLDTQLVKQTSQIESFFQETVKQLKATVDASAQAAELARSEKSAPPQPKRQPWIWIATNAIIVGLTVMCCMYYIAACALVAFVPKTTTDPKTAGSGASPSTDGAAAGAPPPRKQRVNPTRKPLGLADDVM